MLCLLLLFDSAGEINFNIIGVMFQLSSIVTESIRLVLVQILLQVSTFPGCVWETHTQV